MPPCCYFTTTNLLSTASNFVTCWHPYPALKPAHTTCGYLPFNTANYTVVPSRSVTITKRFVFFWFQFAGIALLNDSRRYQNTTTQLNYPNKQFLYFVDWNQTWCSDWRDIRAGSQHVGTTDVTVYIIDAEACGHVY